MIKPSAPSTDFQTAKQYLKKLENTADGVSIYDHLTEIIANILEQRPNESLQMFEMFSYFSRKGSEGGSLIPQQKRSIYEPLPNKANSIKINPDDISWAQGFLNLINVCFFAL